MPSLITSSRIIIQDDSMDETLLSNAVFAIGGIAMGYFSQNLSTATGIPELNVIFVLVLMAAIKLLLEKFAKIKHPLKWWLGNGIGIGLFLWLIAWTIMFNLALF